VSKTKTTKEEPDGNHIRRWAEHVAGALVHLDGSKLTDTEREAVATVHNIAVTLNLYLDGEASEVDLAAVRRACRALERARTDGERIAIGHRLIRMHAERAGLKYLAGVPEDVAADFLVAHLQVDVHPDFAAVDRVAVKELLAKYTNTKNRRGGKLTATGIFVALNKLAGAPFGRGLSVKSVDSHVTRNP
jgi:hypothetical protein